VELLYTKGVMDWYSDLFIMSYDNMAFEMDWESNYLPSISSISINDVNNDGITDLILATRPGDLLIFEDPLSSLDVWEAKLVPVGFEIIHVFSDNFDGDTTMDIVVTDAHNWVFFLEYNGFDYEIVHQIQIDHGGFTAATTEDVDGDGYCELIISNFNGVLDVLGFEGVYTIEWEGQITDNGITALTTGDYDNDDKTEIAVGGFDFIIYLLSYNGSGYSEETYKSMGTMIFTMGIGDTDYDGLNELVVEIGYFELKVFSWVGTFIQDWNITLPEDAHNEAMEISFIDKKGEDQIAIGLFELYILGNNSGYDTLYKSETFTFLIQSLVMGDLDKSGTNEILISTGSYIFVYGKQRWAFASLSASNTFVDIGESITFDGSNSKGEGPLEYLFDFGDGTNTGWITQSTITHSYTSSGTYIASLKIRDTSMNESTNSAEVTISVLPPNIKPYATIHNINPNPAMITEQVNFNGSGWDDDGYITVYRWESSVDGPLSDASSFSTTALSQGNHTIYFKVKDDRNDWSDIVTKDLEILHEPENQIPLAYIDSISPNPGTFGELITFTGHGEDTDGLIVSYLWESDLDGELSVMDSFSTTSLSVGAHIISFKVQDDQNVWSEAHEVSLVIENIPQNQPPLAFIDSIFPNPAMSGEIVTFMGIGEDDDGQIVSYLWESDIDGELSDFRSFSTDSLSVGRHTITLYVFDDEDAKSEPVSQILEIKEKEDDEEDRFLVPVLVVSIIVTILGVSLVLMAISKKKKNNEITKEFRCYSCQSVYKIESQKRPLLVECPVCKQPQMLVK
jgi:hypothetical protein